MGDELLTLGELHGSRLVGEDGDGELTTFAGFTCNDWPECETCGHLEEKNVSLNEETKERLSKIN